MHSKVAFLFGASKFMSQIQTTKTNTTFEGKLEPLTKRTRYDHAAAATWSVASRLTVPIEDVDDDPVASIVAAVPSHVALRARIRHNTANPAAKRRKRAMCITDTALLAFIIRARESIKTDDTRTQKRWKKTGGVGSLFSRRSHGK